MTSTPETVTLRCPNPWCRVLNTLQFGPTVLELKEKCPHCEKEFTYYPTGRAPDEGIRCQHPACAKFYPIRPLTAAEDRLYRVMPLGGGQKQYFCNETCYREYYVLLEARRQSEVGMANWEDRRETRLRLTPARLQAYHVSLEESDT